MTCPKCKSENVNAQIAEKVKTKHRGCLGWCLWLLLAFCTCGLILIIPLITNSKVKSKTQTWAVCQDCGHRWKVE
jgi:predicted Zn-ribbon and HTH transcriptional regulator